MVVEWLVEIAWGRYSPLRIGKWGDSTPLFNQMGSEYGHNMVSLSGG
jgi:hypothetical protein